MFSRLAGRAGSVASLLAVSTVTLAGCSWWESKPAAEEAAPYIKRMVEGESFESVMLGASDESDEVVDLVQQNSDAATDLSSLLSNNDARDAACATVSTADEAGGGLTTEELLKLARQEFTRSGLAQSFAENVNELQTDIDFDTIPGILCDLEATVTP